METKQRVEMENSGGNEFVWFGRLVCLSSAANRQAGDCHGDCLLQDKKLRHIELLSPLKTKVHCVELLVSSPALSSVSGWMSPVCGGMKLSLRISLSRVTDANTANSQATASIQAHDQNGEKHEEHRLRWSYRSCAAELEFCASAKKQRWTQSPALSLSYAAGLMQRQAHQKPGNAETTAQPTLMVLIVASSYKPQ